MQGASTPSGVAAAAITVADPSARPRPAICAAANHGFVVYTFRRALTGFPRAGEHDGCCRRKQNARANNGCSFLSHATSRFWHLRKLTSRRPRVSDAIMFERDVLRIRTLALLCRLTDWLPTAFASHVTEDFSRSAFEFPDTKTKIELDGNTCANSV